MLRRILPPLTLSLAALLPACGPDLNAINNNLRAKTLQQQGQISSLQDQIKTRDATLASLRDQMSNHAPYLPTLPPDRLAGIFTAAKIQIQPLTDSWDFGDGKGLSGFRVFLRPQTADGAVIPATGNLTLEAFELPPAPAQPRRIGTWTFTPDQMKKNWYTLIGTNHFALDCPWTTPPQNNNITFRAHMTDAVTGLVMEAELSKKITLPTPAATTRP